MPREVSSRSASVRQETSRDNPAEDRQSRSLRPARERRPVATPATEKSLAESVSLAPSVLADLVLSTPVPLDERNVLFGGADPVAEALSIDSGERKLLEKAWLKTRDVIVSHQLESLEHEPSGDALWISSKPFDGAPLRETFLEESSRILGSERAKAMWRLLKADQAFGGWGSKPSSACSLEYVRQSDGSLVYRVTERSAPDAPAGRTWIAAELPPHLREAAGQLGLPLQPPQ